MVHPESAEQLKTVKAVLKALKVEFEPHSNKLPAHVLKSAERGLKQYEAGDGISAQEFMDKHFVKK